ncbi:hypothetical protein [[Flexibacter] sp. ATCC 35208]|uniref:hypothetical protein n=1 Tax=[Flexibacter] sp. ATCC 35208 TaxID=1936242 RepID=UPI0009C58906|nr:hypothetical protein [[Flexibacter] sp. ATCC 35208]OMP75507.1 hypothetical protein BW716_29805 [[Flexibacter] sp. ATCC 35208]
MPHIGEAFSFIYKKDDNNWVLITKRRIRFVMDSVGYEIMVEELDKGDFVWDNAEARMTQFKLFDLQNNIYLLHLERGRAFSSMTTVLFFMARR